MSDADELLEILAVTADIGLELTESAIDIFNSSRRVLDGASRGNLLTAVSGVLGIFIGTLRIQGIFQYFQHLLYIWAYIVEKLLTAGDVIRTRLTAKQKQDLVRRVMRTAERFNVDNVTTLVRLLRVDSPVQRAVSRDLEHFLNEIGHYWFASVKVGRLYGHYIIDYKWKCIHTEINWWFPEVYEKFYCICINWHLMMLLLSFLRVFMKWCSSKAFQHSKLGGPLLSIPRSNGISWIRFP